MLKGDIAKALKTLHPEYSLSDLEEVVEIVFKEMGAALKDGRRVEIRGFGSFCLHEQKGKYFTNPKTGKKTEVPDSYRIVFKPGKDLKKILKQ